MTNKHGFRSQDADFETVQSELLLNLIAIVKIQQLNIELLWEALGSGKAPAHALTQMRENNARLTDSLDQVCGMMTRNGG